MLLLTLRALWRGLRRNSLVFSLVFAVAVLEGSLSGILREPLTVLGFWLPLAFILPFLLIGWAAKLEKRLKMGDRFRRFACLLLIAGSISLGALLWQYEARLQSHYAASLELGPQFVVTEDEREIPRGPPHRRR
jgi:phosphoglycerol transferase MdoB-like AlkP superfamily enzyme